MFGKLYSEGLRYTLHFSVEKLDDYQIEFSDEIYFTANELKNPESTKKIVLKHVSEFVRKKCIKDSAKRMPCNQRPYKKAPMFCKFTKAIQQTFHKLGYYEGKIDGYIDTDLQCAIENYQRDNGLKVTGIFDEETRERLRLPKGLTVSLKNFTISNARLDESEKYVKCGKLKNNTILAMDVKYEIIWKFRNFRGEIPLFNFTRQVVGLDNSYSLTLERKKISPQVSNFNPIPGNSINGEQSTKFDYANKIKSSCRTLKENNTGEIIQQHFIVPQPGKYRYVIILDKKKYQADFVVKPARKR